MMKQVNSVRWQDENHNYIYKDDFGKYICYVNGTTEIFDTFEKAIRFYEVFK